MGLRWRMSVLDYDHAGAVIGPLPQVPNDTRLPT